MEADKEYVVITMDFSRSYRQLIREELNWPTFPIIVLREGNNNRLIGGREALQTHLHGI
jgi:glutaredoxin-related protein